MSGAPATRAQARTTASSASGLPAGNFSFEANDGHSGSQKLAAPRATEQEPGSSAEDFCSDQSR
jgi:hypothetical protein